MDCFNLCSKPQLPTPSPLAPAQTEPEIDYDALLKSKPGISNPGIPRAFELLFDKISESVNEVGVFRVSGNKSHENTIFQCVLNKPEEFYSLDENYTVYSYCGALKKLFKSCNIDLLGSLSLENDDQYISVINQYFSEMPMNKKNLLKSLLDLVKKVVAEHKINKMDVEAFAIAAYSIFYNPVSQSNIELSEDPLTNLQNEGKKIAEQKVTTLKVIEAYVNGDVKICKSVNEEVMVEQPQDDMQASVNDFDSPEKRRNDFDLLESKNGKKNPKIPLAFELLFDKMSKFKHVKGIFAYPGVESHIFEIYNCVLNNPGQFNELNENYSVKDYCDALIKLFGLYNPPLLIGLYEACKAAGDIMRMESQQSDKTLETKISKMTTKDKNLLKSFLDFLKEVLSKEDNTLNVARLSLLVYNSMFGSVYTEMTEKDKLLTELLKAYVYGKIQIDTEEYYYYLY